MKQERSKCKDSLIFLLIKCLTAAFILGSLFEVLKEFPRFLIIISPIIPPLSLKTYSSYRFQCNLLEVMHFQQIFILSPKFFTQKISLSLKIISVKQYIIEASENETLDAIKIYPPIIGGRFF